MDVQLLRLANEVRRTLPVANVDEINYFKMARQFLAALLEIDCKLLDQRDSEKFEQLAVGFIQKWADLSRESLLAELNADDVEARFLRVLASTNSPEGQLNVKEIFERSKNDPPPRAVAERYSKNVEMPQLASLLRALQREAGGSDFYLACRTVAALFNKNSWNLMNARLFRLEQLKVIVCTERSIRGGRQANRFRYVATD
jgi:hypothetical protein